MSKMLTELTTVPALANNDYIMAFNETDGARKAPVSAVKGLVLTKLLDAGIGNGESAELNDSPSNYKALIVGISTSRSAGNAMARQIMMPNDDTCEISAIQSMSVYAIAELRLVGTTISVSKTACAGWGSCYLVSVFGVN